MTVLNKACFILSATSRLSGRRLLLLLPSTPLLRAPSTTCRMASTSSAQEDSDTSGKPPPAGFSSWPTPAAFNALSHSSRSKVYCDFGDAGKMAWKPHDEPPKVFFGCHVDVCVVILLLYQVLRSVFYYGIWKPVGTAAATDSVVLAHCCCVLLQHDSVVQAHSSCKKIGSAAGTTK